MSRLIIAGIVLIFALLCGIGLTFAQGGYTCTQAEGEIAAAESENETVTVVSGAPGIYLATFLKRVMNATFSSSVVVVMERPDGAAVVWLQQGQYLCGPVVFAAAEWRKVKRRVWGTQV